MIISISEIDVGLTLNSKFQSLCFRHNKQLCSRIYEYVLLFLNVIYSRNNSNI